MLDLDKYVNNSIKIKLFGEEVDILEPTMETVMAIDALEQDLTKENVHEKRIETAVLFLNHNKQGIVYEKEAIKKIPFEAISTLIAEVSAMRYKADTDPN